MKPTLPAPVAPSSMLAEVRALGVLRLSSDGSAIMRADGSVLSRMTNLTVSVPAGTYGPSQTVALASTTPNAVIYYTLDGSDPTEESTEYAAPIVIDESLTLRAIAISLSGAPGFIDAAYVIENGTVATPTFDPVAGEVEADSEVAIECATPGASIYYTIDGSPPTIESTLYEAPVVIDEALTIKALAVLAGYADSAVGEAAYTIAP